MRNVKKTEFRITFEVAYEETSKKQGAKKGPETAWEGSDRSQNMSKTQLGFITHPSSNHMLVDHRCKVGPANPHL
jgi:hypothetical protein